MNFNGLTEFLKNVDHNLIHDCEIVVFKEHKCIYKNRFTADDVDPSEDKKDMYYLFSHSILSEQELYFQSCHPF